jgi:hypothetical protein
MNWETVFSTRSVRQLRDATIQLSEAMFYMGPLRGYITRPTELWYVVQCSEVEGVGW